MGVAQICNPDLGFTLDLVWSLLSNTFFKAPVMTNKMICLTLASRASIFPTFLNKQWCAFWHLLCFMYDKWFAFLEISTVHSGKCCWPIGGPFHFEDWKSQEIGQLFPSSILLSSLPAVAVLLICCCYGILIEFFQQSCREKEWLMIQWLSTTFRKSFVILIIRLELMLKMSLRHLETIRFLNTLKRRIKARIT